MAAASPWRRILLIAAPWFALAVLYTPGPLLSGGELEWTKVFPHYLAIFGLWALYTPLIARQVRLFPLAWPLQPRSILAHLLLAAALIVVHALLMGVYQSLSSKGESLLVEWRSNMLGRTGFGMLLYAATVTALTAVVAVQQAHERERSLLQARLTTLHAQLQPHFLYNTLNALAELVHRDAIAADAALTRLSALLRDRLDSDELMHPLSSELRMLDDYLAIQKLLLGDRLQVAISVIESARPILIPCLLLQPLVENAVIHGVSRLRTGGRIAVVGQCDEAALSVEVNNDGPVGATFEAGKGLGLTIERLRAHYGNRYRFEVRPRADGGAIVRLRLPVST